MNCFARKSTWARELYSSNVNLRRIERNNNENVSRFYNAIQFAYGFVHLFRVDYMKCVLPL